VVVHRDSCTDRLELKFTVLSPNWNHLDCRMTASPRIIDMNGRATISTYVRHRALYFLSLEFDYFSAVVHDVVLSIIGER
jgi:hypothetical protein